MKALAEKWFFIDVYSLNIHSLSYIPCLEHFNGSLIAFKVESELLKKTYMVYNVVTTNLSASPLFLAGFCTCWFSTRNTPFLPPLSSPSHG